MKIFKQAYLTLILIPKEILKQWRKKVLQLRVVDVDTRTGPVKVYRVLQQTASIADRLSESHYTVLTLEHLLIVNNRENLHTFMQLTTAPDFVRFQSTVYVQNKQTFEEFI